MANKTGKKAIGYYRIKPENKAWISMQAKKKGYKRTSFYLDALIEKARQAQASKKSLVA